MTVDDRTDGHPRREKREESFMPVEITGGWFRAEKGIGGRIVLGVVCAGTSSPGLLRSGGEEKSAPLKPKGAAPVGKRRTRADPPAESR